MNARLRGFETTPVRSGVCVVVLLLVSLTGAPGCALTETPPGPVLTLPDGPFDISVGERLLLTVTLENAPAVAEIDYLRSSTAVSLAPNGESVWVTGVSEGEASITAVLTNVPSTVSDNVLVRVHANPGSTLPTGLRPSPRPQPEGLQILTPVRAGFSFGSWSNRHVAALSTSVGWTALDLSTGETLHEPAGLTGGPFFGVAAATQDPPGIMAPAGILVFGNSGYAYQNVINGTFTATQVGVGTTFDASPAGGRITTGSIQFVLPGSGVRFVEYQPSSGAYYQTSELVPAPSAGELVSAYVHDGSGSNATGGAPPILLLTRDVQSRVWLNQRDGSASTTVLTLGLDARKLRCIEVAGGGALCGVTLFGANQVAVFTWDGTNAPVFVGNVSAPGQPVDLDLRLLDNGNVALLTTGFGSGALTEVELSQAGAVISHVVGSVPAGCTGAGHAVYVEDAAGLKVVGTCYSSNQYYIVESRF